MTTRSGRLQSQFDDENDSTGLIMWRVTNSWQAAQRATLKPFGLTHVQFVLLASLTHLDGVEAVTQQRLAEHTGSDPMMTSQVVRVLADRGLVDRAPHPDDGRAKVLAITGQGAELTNAAIVAVEACDAEFFAPLGDARTDWTGQLRTLL